MSVKPTNLPFSVSTQSSSFPTESSVALTASQPPIPSSEPLSLVTEPQPLTQQPSGEWEALSKELDSELDTLSIPSMSHKIPAQFLGSTFVTGKQLEHAPLESYPTGAMTHYFEDLLKRVVAEEAIESNPRLEEFYQSLKDMRQVHKAVSLIDKDGLASKDIEAWKIAAKRFSEWMCHRIGSMQAGEKFTLPGGWKKHLMIYEIERMEDDSYIFRVYNTGDGLNYHPGLPEAYNMQYLQILTSQRISAKSMLLSTLWETYFEMTHRKNPTAEADQEIHVKHIYSWLLGLDKDIIPNSLAEAQKKNIPFRRSQRAGRCALESHALLMKTRLSGPDAPPDGLYQSIYGAMCEKMLRDYDAFLVSQGFLGRTLNDKEPPLFSSEESIFANLGVLEFFKEVCDQMRRKTLRGMRKRAELQVKEKISLRSIYLAKVEKRIALRKEYCEQALKRASLLNIPKTGTGLSLHLKKVDTQSLTISSSSFSSSRSHPLTLWSQTHCLPLFELCQKCRAITDKLSDIELYEQLVWCFESLPSINNSSYWDSVCKNKALCQLYIQSIGELSTAYFILLQKLKIPLQADLHFFAMQKALCILIRLTENDPVMQGCHIDLDALGLTERHFHKGALFSTLPKIEKEALATRHFFTHYLASGSGKVVLFSEMEKFQDQSKIAYSIPHNFEECNDTLRYIWQKMDNKTKEEIAKTLGERYQHTPPNALILATALSSTDADCVPSKGYRAIQQHLLNMLILFHCGFDPEEETAYTQKPSLQLSLAPWDKTFDPFCNFHIKLEKKKHSRIDYAIARALVQDPSSATELAERGKTEKEVMEKVDSSIIPYLSLQCPEDESHQLLKTLLYYSQNRHLLHSPDERMKLTSFLFELGLLQRQIKTNPDGIKVLIKFIKRGYHAFAADEQNLDTAFFFLRLSSQLEAYCDSFGWDKGDFLDFFKALEIHWKKAQKLQPAQKKLQCLKIAREGVAYCVRGTVSKENIYPLLKYYFVLHIGQKVKQTLLETEVMLAKRVLINNVWAMGQSQEGSSVCLALSQILDLDADQEALVEWDMEKRSVIASKDGVYQIDLLSGHIFINGRCAVARIPNRIAKDSTFQRLFPHPEQLTNLFLKDDGYNLEITFRDKNKVAYRVFYNKHNHINYVFRTFPDGEYIYYLGDHPHFDSHPWYNEKEKSIHFINDKQELTHIFKDRQLLEKETGFFAVDIEQQDPFFERLKTFDKATQVWKDDKNRLVRIDFPTYDLVLDVDSEGIIRGRGALEGFIFAKEQYIRSLNTPSGYLVFVHHLNGEKRVLVPMHTPQERMHFDEPLTVKSWEPYRNTYCTFEVQKDKRESLYSTSCRDRLYLALHYLKQRKYFQASAILQTQAEKLSPYDVEERDVLIELISFTEEDDKDTRAHLVRLRACALVLKNYSLGKLTSSNEELQRRWQNQEKHFQSLFQSLFFMLEGYLDECRTLPESIRLSREEITLITEKPADNTNLVTWRTMINRTRDVFPVITEPLLLENSYQLPNIDYWKINSFAPADVHLLERETLPMQLNEKELADRFLSLYAIAISIDEDKEESRNKLRIWLSCHLLSEHRQIARILHSIVCAERIRMQELPPVEKILTHMEDRQLREALQKKLEADFRETLSPMPSYLRKIKTAQIRGKDIFPDTSVFDSAEPINGLTSSEKVQTPLIPDSEKAFSPIEKQTLTTTPPIAIAPLVTLTTPFYTRTFDSINTSIQKAQEHEGEQPQWDITKGNLLEMEKGLKEDIQQQKEEIRSVKRKLIALANVLPRGYGRNKNLLAVDAQLQPFLTIKDLKLLYLKNSRIAYGAANSTLTKEDIEDLYKNTEQWLILSTEQKSRRRILRIIELIKVEKDPHQRRQYVQRLYKEVHAKRAFDVQEYPAGLLFEHERDLLLRENQVKYLQDILKGKRVDEIAEIIMGNGKSDVIGPLLTLGLSDGRRLVFLVLLEELIETEAPKLQRYAMDFFGQKEIRLNWKVTSSEELWDLDHTLESIKNQGGFVAITPRELHDFYLEEQALFREYLKAHPLALPTKEDKLKQNEYESRLTARRRIRGLLYNDGFAIFDEAHLQFSCKFEVLKALDKAQQVPLAYRHITSNFYASLTCDERITSKIYFDWFSARKTDALPYCQERDAEWVIDILAENLLDESVLKACHIIVSSDDLPRIRAFLKAPEGKCTPLPTAWDSATKNSLGFARRQLHAILPSTLGKIYEQTYGLIPNSRLPVPWRGARCPQTESQFAHYGEWMSLAFQSYYKMGASKEILEAIFSQLKTQAHLEIEASPLLLPLQDTAAYKQYAALLGEALLQKFPDFNTLISQEIEQIAHAISQDPLKLNLLVSEHILPLITWYPAHIASNGQTLASLFRWAIGLSGTAYKDAGTYPRRFKTSLDPDIIGKTLLALSKGPAPLILQPKETQQEQLKALLETAEGHPPHVIIDSGALFKDIPPIEVAQILLDFGSRQKPELISVIYFDGNKRLILKKGCKKPEMYTPSTTDDPCTRMTFYDQNHCTGMDILQHPTACAFMTVALDSTTQKSMQSAWRMRDLPFGQKITLVCSKEVAVTINRLSEGAITDLRAENILAYVQHVEILQQLEDNRKAVLQQIRMEFVHTCQKIVDSFEDELREPYGGAYYMDSAIVHTALLELNDLMITVVRDDPYAQYEQAEELIEAQKVLDAYLKTLVLQLSAWHEKHSKLLGGESNNSEFQEFCSGIPHLIIPNLGSGRNSIEELIHVFGEEMSAFIASVTNPEKSILAPKLSTQLSTQEGTEIEVQQEQGQDLNIAQEKTTHQISTIQRPYVDFGLPHLPWHSMDEIGKEEFFNPIPLDIPPAEISAYRRALIGRQSESTASQNPILSAMQTLALTGRYTHEDAPLNPDMRGLFSPDLLISLNASCSNWSDPPLFESQKLLEWALIIQDKEHPYHPRLLLLSRTEAESFKIWLEEDATKNLTSDKQRPLAFALFSPRLHAMNYNEGIYAEGSIKLQRDKLFSPSGLQLIAQAKFLMGETALYSRQERAYLKSWLGKLGNLSEMENFFKEGLLPGSLQNYENSPLKKLFCELQTSTVSEPFSPGSSSNSSNPAPTDQQELLPPPPEEEITPPNDTPPVDNPHSLPFETWGECNALPFLLILEAKESCIEWLLANWTGELATSWNKPRMGQHLRLQISTMVFEIADNLRFSEVLDKILLQFTELTPKPKRIKPLYGTKLTNEEREQQRREHIKWLLDNWKETNVEKMEKVRKNLEQIQINYLYDLVDNPNFVETLNKFV